MSSIITARSGKETTIFDSPTFDKDIRIHVDQAIGSASISPSGRDVVLASQQGLHIIDLDSPYSPPRHLRHQTSWTPADVQWSPFASRYYWVVSTSNQRALVWNLELASLHAPIEHTLHAHSRAITDINFSPLHPDLLATCAVDAFVHCWDLRVPARPVVSFSDWFAGATQVKWSRRDEHIIASSHDKYLHVWDDRKGAIPLKTIEAHQTKIYGIDWSRKHATKIVTCSLDRTLKLWDYEISETEPERTINTAFPVWRARHTPFGNGVLAMPQRGDNDLHMYDYQSIPEDVPSQIQPDYRFTGHDDHVKEFLWRVRGNVDENTDSRDFQLVSWGTDRELILHRIGEKQLQAVGHQKGMRPERTIKSLRGGAPYKSFKDRHIPAGPAADGTTTSNQGPVFPPLGSSPGMNKAPIPIPGDWADGGTMMTYSGIETRNVKQQDNGLITWMKGVKFGKRKPSSPEKQRFRRVSLVADIHNAEYHGSRESLSDEIIHVGEKFKKVTFEEADVSNRHVKVSLNGPWALDGELVFIQLSMDFPPDYPESSTPWLHIEKASALSEEKVAEIESDLRKITSGYLTHRRGCIEGLLSYLLGERNLHESIGWLGMHRDSIRSDDQAESSSDEEDGLLGEFGGNESQTLGMENSMGSGIFSSNANVPLPRTCGALWAPNGQLICFMPPKQEPRSILQKFAVEDRERGRGSKEIFEGFGRLHTTQTDPKDKSRIDDIFEDEESDDSSEFSSSSSSSSGSDPPEILLRKFQPPSAWHGGSLRFPRFKTNSTEGSMPTSNGANKKASTVRNKTLVKVLNMEAFVPSKRALANDYLIYGDGGEVCSHNARVAQMNGFAELAEIWELIGLILAQKVPLNLLSLPSSDGDVRVLARRALVQMRRNDSGLDLSFDEPPEVLSPQEEALIRWGNHPFASTWLVKVLFEFFEKSQDMQMLGMMSCVLGQLVSADSQRPIYEKLPDSMVCAAQSKDYFPTNEAAIGFFEPIISISSASSKKQRKMGTAQESAWSSHDSGELELLASEPVTPFSTGTTPPMLLSRGIIHRSSMPPSLADSPEQHRTSIQSATSSFAASVIARPFTLASSPPIRTRISGEELSTSVPSNAAANWSRASRHFKRRDSTVRRSFVSQCLVEDDDGSATDDDEPFTPQTRVKITLQNQGMFDDEGCANLALLDPSHSMKFAHYRKVYANMLGAWGLQMQQNEVSKFNGLLATASSSNKPRDRSSQSTLRLGEDEHNHDLSESLGPQIVRCCISCGDVDNTARRTAVDNRCASCGGRSQILPCTICHQPIAGLYKVCMACGHAAHIICLSSLLESLPEDERPECEAGCDCICGETVSGEEAFGLAKPTLQKLPKDVGFQMLPLEHSTIFTRRGSIEAKQTKIRDRTWNEPVRVTNNGLRKTRTRSVGH